MGERANGAALGGRLLSVLHRAASTSAPINFTNLAIERTSVDPPSEHSSGAIFPQARRDLRELIRYLRRIGNAL